MIPYPCRSPPASARRICSVAGDKGGVLSESLLISESDYIGVRLSSQLQSSFLATQLCRSLDSTGIAVQAVKIEIMPHVNKIMQSDLPVRTRIPCLDRRGQGVCPRPKPLLTANRPSSETSRREPSPAQSSETHRPS